jgi:aminopeptidase S
VFEELGSGDNDAAVWASFSTSLNSFAGQTIYLLIEAADAGSASLVEAAVDDVLIESGP